MYELLPIPVAARTKAWVCGSSLAGIAGSNPAGSMDVCILGVLCVVRYRPLRRADHSSRGVLPNVVCVTECDREASIMRRPWPTSGCCAVETKYIRELLNIPYIAHVNMCHSCVNWI